MEFIAVTSSTGCVSFIVLCAIVTMTRLLLSDTTSGLQRAAASRKSERNEAATDRPKCFTPNVEFTINGRSGPV